MAHMLELGFAQHRWTHKQDLEAQSRERQGAFMGFTGGVTSPRRCRAPATQTEAGFADDIM